MSSNPTTIAAPTVSATAPEPAPPNAYTPSAYVPTTEKPVVKAVTPNDDSIPEEKFESGNGSDNYDDDDFDDKPAISQSRPAPKAAVDASKPLFLQNSNIGKPALAPSSLAAKGGDPNDRFNKMALERAK